MIRVHYSSKQSVQSNRSFSPSAGKPEKVVESWAKLDVPFTKVRVSPATRKDLYKVHSKDYVDDVLRLERDNGFGNRLPEVAKALPHVAGSMVGAAIDALKNGGVTFSPTSGAHHACWESGGSFCTFNFLVLAALKAHEMGAKKVGILDLDCHYGNGTVDIIKKLKLDFIQHYSFGGDRRIEDPQKWLDDVLPPTVLGYDSCDLLIYNAGVDSHVDDPLGGYLTTEMLKTRDDGIFSIMSQFGIPVAVSLAGGYQKDESGSIRKVLELHDNTFLMANKHLAAYKK